MEDEKVEIVDDHTYYECIACLIADIEEVFPDLLDRKLPKKLQERLHNILLDAKDLKEDASIWIH
jgi:hypothetical protein